MSRPVHPDFCILLQAFLLLSMGGTRVHAGEVDSQRLTDGMARQMVVKEFLQSTAARSRTRATLQSVPALRESLTHRSDGTCTLMRCVATPERLAARQPPAAEAAPTTIDASRDQASPPSVRKESRPLSLSAVIHDGTLSEIRWPYAGQEYLVYAGFDISLLGTLPVVETADAMLHFFLAWERVDSGAELWRAHLAASQGVDYSPRLFPEDVDFPDDPPAFLVTPDENGLVPAGLEAELRAVLDYFTANREFLETMRANSCKLTQARERILRDNPPDAGNTVINFFSILTDPQTPAIPNPSDPR